MYLYLYFLLFMLFIKFDGHSYVMDQATIKYRKWTSLNNLISIKHQNYISVFYYSMKLLCQALYISLCQWLNSYLVKQDKNTYLLTYNINGKVYKNLIKVKRGPCPILQVSNEDTEDVTSNVLQYLGPTRNWHGNKYTPEILGYKTLVFECDDGEEKVYNDKDVIPDF